MAKASDAQIAARKKYRKLRTRAITLEYKTELYDEVAEAAKAAGEPLATYCKTAIKERMERGY